MRCIHKRHDEIINHTVESVTSDTINGSETVSAYSRVVLYPLERMLFFLNRYITNGLSGKRKALHVFVCVKCFISYRNRHVLD